MLIQNTIKFLILFILFQSIMVNCDECDDKSARRLDSTVAKMVTIGQAGRKFPENLTMLKKYCDDSKTYVTQIEKYKDQCLKDVQKQTVSVMVYSMKASINTNCKNDSKRVSDLLSSTSCMNSGSIHLNKCYTKYIDSILGAKHADDNKKIPINCCSYYQIMSCSEEKLRKMPGCSDKHIETGMDFIRSLFGNVINLICGDYTEGSDFCKRLGQLMCVLSKPIIFQLQGPAPPKKKYQRRPKSFILPLLDLFSTIKEI